MAKNLLILKASDDVCKVELAHIATTSVLFNIKPHIINIDSYESLNKIKDLNIRFDYIYLCAHANHIGFGDNKGLTINWLDFGEAICEDAIINEGCVFLLACCRSGLNRVAYDLFASCNLIEFVCGPRWTLEDKDLTVAFTVFLYNMEVKRMQPNFAAKRMSKAVDYEFTCFDRVEIEMTSDYQNYLARLQEAYAYQNSLPKKEATENAEILLPEKVVINQN